MHESQPTQLKPHPSMILGCHAYCFTRVPRTQWIFWMEVNVENSIGPAVAWGKSNILVTRVQVPELPCVSCPLTSTSVTWKTHTHMHIERDGEGRGSK